MENLTVMSTELAQVEVTKWLDAKRVKAKKREALSDAISGLTEAFEEGTLRLDDNDNLIQTLIFPITNSEGEVTVKELVYVPRITVKKINQSMNGVKSDDLTGIMASYVSALTGNVRPVVLALDTDDFKIGQTIATFFF